MSKARPCLHIWCPETRSRGGIQAYSRTLSNGIRNARPDVTLRVIELGSGGIVSKLTFLLRTSWWLIMDQPDVVWMTHYHLARASALLRRWGIPYWISLHGIECWDLPKPRDRKLLRAAAKLLPVSGFTRDRVQEQLGDGIPSMEVLTDFLEPATAAVPERIEARKKLRVDDACFMIITLSRLSAAERYKGHRELMALLPELSRRHPDLHWWVLGGGDDLEALKAEVNRLNINSCVTFTGSVDEETKWDYIAASDLFLLAGTGEGFGIVLLEAMRAGVPVVGSMRDGSSEPLAHGDLGLLTDPLDSDRLLSDLDARITSVKRDTCTAKGTWLRDEVEKRFGSAALQKRLCALMETL